MSWEVLHKGQIMYNNKTGEMGVMCGCGGEVMVVGNLWRDVTADFTWHEKIVPLYYAAMAGNKVIQLIAQIQLLEEVGENIHLFDTDKWRSKTDSNFAIMNVHENGTVTMINAQHFPDGYVCADLTGVALSDTLYVNIFVPVE